VHCVCDTNRTFFQTTCPLCPPVSSLIDLSCGFNTITGPDTTPCGQTGSPVLIFCAEAVRVVLADGTIRCQDSGNGVLSGMSFIIDSLTIQCQSNGQYLATIAPAQTFTAGPCNPLVGGPPVFIAGAMSIRCLNLALFECIPAAICNPAATGCWLYAMNLNKVCIVVQPGSLFKLQKPGYTQIVILTCILSRVVSNKQVPTLFLGKRFHGGDEHH
jgi:hypothetical protein